MDSNSRRPSYAEVYRLAFSRERYAKRIAELYADDAFNNSCLGEPAMPRNGLGAAMVRQSGREERHHGLFPAARDHADASQEGALEGLTHMPVDILYEIFSHLHPRDVLTLSRTTKGLREILQAPHAHSVWKASLANVQGLPECPNDMTEYQYASLAFDHWCHFCLAPGVREVAWICRVRCCKKCFQQYFISEDELDQWIPEDILVENPELIFPFAISQKRRGGRNQPKYYLPSALELLEELEKLLRVDRSPEGLSEWSQKKKRLQLARITHASLCERWYTYKVYRNYQEDTPALYWEAAIVVWIAMVLCCLGREQITSVLSASRP